MGFLIHQLGFHPGPCKNYIHCLRDILTGEELQRQKEHSSNQPLQPGSMRTNKPAIEKMKNETEGVEWLIFEALFKLGRNL